MPVDIDDEDVSRRGHEAARKGTVESVGPANNGDGTDRGLRRPPHGHGDVRSLACNSCGGQAEDDAVDERIDDAGTKNRVRRTGDVMTDYERSTTGESFPSVKDHWGTTVKDHWGTHIAAPSSLTEGYVSGETSGGD